jgi:hypothetical protein
MFGPQQECRSVSAATPPPTLPGFLPPSTSTPLTPITQGSSATRIGKSHHLFLITSAFLLFGSIVG